MAPIILTTLPPEPTWAPLAIHPGDVVLHLFFIIFHLVDTLHLQEGWFYARSPSTSLPYFESVLHAQTSGASHNL